MRLSVGGKSIKTISFYKHIFYTHERKMIMLPFIPQHISQMIKQWIINYDIFEITTKKLIILNPVIYFTVKFFVPYFGILRGEVSYS